MAARVSVFERVVKDIRVPIEGLRIAWPPRATHLLPLTVAELEPEAKLVLLVHLGEKLRLVKADGQRFDGHAVHPTRGVARHNRIRRDEAPDARVIIARIIRQQPRDCCSVYQLLRAIQLSCEFLHGMLPLVSRILV